MYVYVQIRFKMRQRIHQSYNITHENSVLSMLFFFYLSINLIAKLMIKSLPISGEICVARDARVVLLLFNERLKVLAMFGKYIHVKWNKYMCICLYQLVAAQYDYLIIILDMDEKFNPFVRKIMKLNTFWKENDCNKSDEILLYKRDVRL